MFGAADSAILLIRHGGRAARRQLGIVGQGTGQPEKATYEFEVRPEADYLHITITGFRTAATISAIAKDIYDTCIKHQCFKVLVDTRRMTGRLSVLDQYYVPSYRVPKNPRAKTIQLAVIDDESERHKWSFFETVTRNLGYKLRIITDIDAAVNWLRSSGPDTPPEM